MDISMRSPEPVGWPFPWWGLLCGGVFLAAMFTPLGGFMGVIAGFGLALLAMPFFAIGALIGGDGAGPLSALIGLSGLVMLGIGKLAVDIARAPDRRARSLLMNRLALFLLSVAGLVVAVLALEDAWRY
jgi:hypothetical protein